ncbi:hypothetical protein RJZ90_007258 [Blastomyces dermatitidis]
MDSPSSPKHQSPVSKRTQHLLTSSLPPPNIFRNHFARSKNARNPSIMLPIGAPRPSAKHMLILSNSRSILSHQLLPLQSRQIVGLHPGALRWASDFQGQERSTQS